MIRGGESFLRRDLRFQFGDGVDFSADQFPDHPRELAKAFAKSAETDMYQFQAVMFEAAVPLDAECFKKSVDGFEQFGDTASGDVFQRFEITIRIRNRYFIDGSRIFSCADQRSFPEQNTF